MVLIDHLPIAVTNSERFAEFAIADDATRAVVTLDRRTAASPPSRWPDAFTRVSLMPWVQLGGIWRRWFGLISEGAPFLDRGVEAPETRHVCGLPRGVGRAIRIEVDVTGPMLRTLLTLEVR